MVWQKLLARESTDAIIISGIDVAFFKLFYEFTGKKKEYLFTHHKDKDITHYISIDPKKVGRWTYKKYFNTPKQINKYYQTGKILLKNIEKKTTHWKKELKQNKLLEAFKDFRKQYLEVVDIYSIISWTGIETWQDDFEKVISGLIKKNKLEEKRNVILQSVQKPWKKTALIELEHEIAKGVPLKKLVKEYQFLRSWTLWYKEIDEEWIKEISNIQKEKIKLYNEKELIKILKPNKEETHFLKMAPYITFFKDWRDDIRRKHIYSWVFLFEKIAKKYCVEYNDIGYFTLDEIEDMLKKDCFDYETLKLRKGKEFIMIPETNKPKVKVINQVPQKYRAIINRIKNSKINDVKGLIVQKGKAIGRVKIINTYHDIKRVEKGDILVSNTTHTNYLPAMKRSAAIITNEGGITCHAAIVARELNKPCIVGTKNATRVLKDGDLVEVDANQGIVRKIK
ncbi:MAG: hypothetical protein KKF89_03615 [Nanoarchaeota archaeon]|nr:hypothetical protein [Nanoarchaeota archaeon]